MRQGLYAVEASVIEGMTRKRERGDRQERRRKTRSRSVTCVRSVRGDTCGAQTPLKSHRLEQRRFVCLFKKREGRGIHCLVVDKRKHSSRHEATESRRK